MTGVVGEVRVRVVVRSGVDGHGAEPGNSVDEGVLGGDGQLVGLDNGQVGVDDHIGLRMQRVADPAHPHLPGASHSVHPVCDPSNGVGPSSGRSRSPDC
jgi:hypothetical protein